MSTPFQPVLCPGDWFFRVPFFSPQSRKTCGVLPLLPRHLRQRALFLAPRRKQGTFHCDYAPHLSLSYPSCELPVPLFPSYVPEQNAGFSHIQRSPFSYSRLPLPLARMLSPPSHILHPTPLARSLYFRIAKRDGLIPDIVRLIQPHSVFRSPPHSPYKKICLPEFPNTAHLPIFFKIPCLCCLSVVFPPPCALISSEGPNLCNTSLQALSLYSSQKEFSGPPGSPRTPSDNDIAPAAPLPLGEACP